MTNSFYSITDFISKVSLAHPSVKTFTLGDLNDIDINKQSIFPLVHLIINNATITSGKTSYDVTLMAMDKPENIVPESSGSYNALYKDYRDVDNSIDLWNTTLEVLNDVYSYLLRNPDALDYNIDGDAICTPFKERFDNLLVGWGADFTITVGNTNNICVISL